MACRLRERSTADSTLRKDSKQYLMGSLEHNAGHKKFVELYPTVENKLLSLKTSVSYLPITFKSDSSSDAEKNFNFKFPAISVILFLS